MNLKKKELNIYELKLFHSVSDRIASSAQL